MEVKVIICSKDSHIAKQKQNNPDHKFSKEIKIKNN